MLLDRTVSEIATLLGGRCEGETALRLAALRPPELAGPADLAVIFRATVAAEGLAGRAGALLVAHDCVLPPGTSASVIRVPDPDAALDRLTAEFAPRPPRLAPGVHPSAVIEAGARLDELVAVGPQAWVGAGAVIGARSVLHAGARVGPGAVLGSDCELHENSVVAWGCTLGRRVILHPGVVIGAPGFGLRQDEAGRHARVPQRGSVELGDDVEIGSNSSVDRARFDVTVIGAGSKLDAQVHVGHNVRIGRHCALAGGVLLAGGVVLEDHVLIGGGAGVANNVRIGRAARVAGRAVVLSDCPPEAVIGGWPARPSLRWKREVLALARLPELLAEWRGKRRESAP